MRQASLRGSLRIDRQRLSTFAPWETSYDYIIAKVRIFDFEVGFRPLGESGPELVFSLNEESYRALSRQSTNRDDPEPGALGDYAIGYAFIKSPLVWLSGLWPGPV